jgi:hypothetical protein
MTTMCCLALWNEYEYVVFKVTLLCLTILVTGLRYIWLVLGNPSYTAKVFLSVMAHMYELELSVDRDGEG